MEVTRKNFKEVLPIISEAIEDASFLAIDAEFSGLTIKRRENSMDTCEERYRKLVNGVRDFTVMQFGICAFSWDDEQQQYVAKPFNFYIFPKPYNRQMPDMRFLCQTSSLDFLANKGFDFNKWIGQGIPFLLPPDEDRLRTMISIYEPKPNGESSTANTNEATTIPPHFEKTMELIMKKVENFVNDPDMKSLSLPPSTPMLRKLVYESVKATYTTGLHLESKKNEQDEKFIMISKCSEEEKKELQSDKFDRELDEVEQAVGFSKVIRILSQSGKVILGHNMLLDLLHVVRLFVAPLPCDLEGFKSLVKGVLPRLIDTKVMASTQPLKDHFPISHLEEVFRKSSEAPFVKPNVFLPEEFEDYSDSTKAHEAGYDAYMTGVAFIAMASFLEKQRDGSNPCGEMDVEVIKPFLNKIFLFPRMEDIPYLDLSGEDVVPRREHVFFVEHPNNWHYTDVQKLFKEFGSVYVTKVNGTSSFASVVKRERAGKVMQKLNKEGAPYRIMRYNDYHNIDGANDEHDDGNDSVDGRCSFINTSSNHTPTPDTPAKTPEPTPSKRPQGDISSEFEDGQLPDSPEPAKKKLKGEHTWFEEPDEW